MNISREACRLCLSTTDFNISLFSSYCRKSKMLDKILVCLKLIIEETDPLTTICYKCADSVERFYDFNMFVKNSQTKLDTIGKVHQSMSHEAAVNVTRRHVTSYVHEVVDADYSFSFLDVYKNEDQKEAKTSSPFFSYFSPPNMSITPIIEQRAWKTQSRFNDVKNERKPTKIGPQGCKMERPRQHSIDIFESQYQDVEDVEVKSLDCKLTPDEALFKRLREKCFGKSNF